MTQTTALGNAGKKLRVLVVDDSALYRKHVRDIVASAPAVEVVGVAFNGRSALEQVPALQPDLLTLDLEMPELDGLGVLRELGRLPKRPGAIMLSAHTKSGAAATISALRLGAFDFIAKPSTGGLDESLAELRRSLVPKVEAFHQQLLLRQSEVAAAPVPAAPAPASRSAPAQPPRVLAIGVSTGGPAALAALLPALPAKLRVPIVLVQHMPPLFTESLARDLDEKSKLKVVEAAAGMVLEPGVAYVAPGGRHMKLALTPQGVVVKLTDDPPEKSCRPSVDYLFRSVAEVYGARSLAVVLTGMGDDGLEGARALRRVGGQILAQDRASCTVYGMPRAVIEAGLVDGIYPLADLAAELERRLDARVLACV
jgi:two-component system chemotaxis response regulator CheB